jgi:hypothetical protein
LLSFLCCDNYAGTTIVNNKTSFSRKPAVTRVVKVSSRKVSVYSKNSPVIVKRSPTIKSSPVIVSSTGSGSKIVQVAKRDLGVKEGSRRANEIARASGMSSSVGRRHPWCAATVSDWLVRSGLIKERSPSVATVKHILRDNGWKRTSKPVVGSVAFYKNWSHIGVVAEVKGKYAVLIEGNSLNMVRQQMTPINRLEYWVRS